MDVCPLTAPSFDSGRMLLYPELVVLGPVATRLCCQGSLICCWAFGLGGEGSLADPGLMLLGPVMEEPCTGEAGISAWVLTLGSVVKLIPGEDTLGCREVPGKSCHDAPSVF